MSHCYESSPQKSSNQATERWTCLVEKLKTMGVPMVRSSIDYDFASVSSVMMTRRSEAIMNEEMEKNPIPQYIGRAHRM